LFVLAGLTGLFFQVFGKGYLVKVLWQKDLWRRKRSGHYIFSQNECSV